MRLLRADADPDAFFAGLAEAPSRVLLLDYDGTLAPFRPERDRAVPYPGVRGAVRRVQEQGRTRVVVISGRSVEDLCPLLGLEPPPEIWGTHGWERLRPDGTLERIQPGETALEGLRDARARVSGDAAAGRVEVKPASVALHVRGLEPGDADRLLRDVRNRWAPLAESGHLELHDFDGGVEIRPRGRHKGSAVEEVLADEPEAVAVSYLGDDLTDEDAFRALEGRGLTVLVRPRLRDTVAAVWIRPPDELLAFLERWRRASARPP